MRIIRLIILAALVVVCLVVALANIQPVTLRVLPDTMAGFMGISWTVTMPLFVVILGGVLVGLVIGFVAEWFREQKHRSEARHQRREKEALRRRMEAQRNEQRGRGDDVLALLEDGSAPR